MEDDSPPQPPPRRGRNQPEILEDKLPPAERKRAPKGPSGFPSRNGHNLLRSPGSAVSSLLEEEPETTIGSQVKMKGELSFDQLLRIDGKFEGKLVSTGNLIVGDQGALIGDVEGMNELYCEGKIIGNINVKRLELKSSGFIYGDVCAVKAQLDEGCIVVGSMNLNPHAPDFVDRDGKVVSRQGKGNAEGKKTESGESAKPSKNENGDKTSEVDNSGESKKKNEGTTGSKE